MQAFLDEWLRPQVAAHAVLACQDRSGPHMQIWGVLDGTR